MFHLHEISVVPEQLCGIYIKELPTEVLVNDIYLSNVKTFESLSESTIQLALNGTVMKEFGIDVEKPWVQIVGAVLSMLSIYRSLAARYAFLQHNVDPGFSMKLAKAMGIFLLPTLSTFTLLIATWFAKQVNSIASVATLMYFHPVVMIGFCKFIGLLTRRTFDWPFLTIFASLNGLSYFVVYFLFITFIRIQEGEKSSKSYNKIFNSSVTFNFCETGKGKINNNTDITEWASSEQIFWVHWMWILPFLFIMIMIANAPCHRRCRIVKDSLAPSVSTIDFVKGPKIAVNANQEHDSNADNQGLEQGEEIEDNQEAIPMIAIPISSESQSEEEENDPDNENNDDVEDVA